MFEPPPYRDITELSKRTDDELVAMADKGELSVADLVAIQLQKSINEESLSQPAQVQPANDGFNDPYVASVMKQVFPE